MGSIAEFINLYGRENVIFVHLLQKHELAQPNKLGMQLRG